MSVALSPSEAFLSDDERRELDRLEERVDELLKEYAGGNDPIYFTHTFTGNKEPPISVLNALMERYRNAGWGKVAHANTKDGKGIAFAAW